MISIYIYIYIYILYGASGFPSRLTRIYQSCKPKQGPGKGLASVRHAQTSLPRPQTLGLGVYDQWNGVWG